MKDAGLRGRLGAPLPEGDHPPPSVEEIAPPTRHAPGKAHKHGPLLIVDGLSKIFPRGSALSKASFVHAVDGVSFAIRRAETLGLVGESGCGKTTLGRTVLRLQEPTVGRIMFDDLDVTAMRRNELRLIRRRMQIIFQDPYSSLNPRMTVREIVSEGLLNFGIGKDTADRDRRVARALERVGLGDDALARYPHEFSGGQRQRIGIARAMIVEPDFVVCDEATSSLDVSVQAQILNLLEGLQEERGTSYLFISHDLRVIRATSHRIAVMYLGRIVEVGPVEVVSERSLHPYTRALWAAVPQRTADGRVHLTLAGEPPSAAAPPPGCVFHPRCPRAQPGKCDVEVPPLSEIEQGSRHRVACWFPVR